MNIVHLIDCMEFMKDIPDKDYWEAQEERYNQHAMQGDLFSSEDTQKAIYQETFL